MDNQQKILFLVKSKGPLLPSQINKELNVDVLFASAMLSELVDRKLLRLSKAKIGGSPVYYAQGQESKLDILYPYLNEKERRAYDLLKENKVLRASSFDSCSISARQPITDIP